MNIFRGPLGVVTVATILIVAVSWIGWGFWAAFSIIYPIILTGLCAVFLLWARTGMHRWRTVDRQDEPFEGYPKDHVLGMFDTTRAAGEALDDLQRSGFTSDDLTVFTDRQGAARLDSEGTSHGVRQLAQRQLEHVLTDIDDLSGYEDIVRRGGVAISVMAPKEDTRYRAAEVLRRHGGHDVHYFGSMMVQRMDVDRTRTKAAE